MKANGGNSAGAYGWDSDFRDHFLYLPEKLSAEVAAEPLLAKGWTVQVARSADDEGWLVFATDHFPSEEEFESERQELERLAEELELGGRYEGWGEPC